MHILNADKEEIKKNKQMLLDIVRAGGAFHRTPETVCYVIAKHYEYFDPQVYNIKSKVVAEILFEQVVLPLGLADHFSKQLFWQLNEQEVMDRVGVSLGHFTEEEVNRNFYEKLSLAIIRMFSWLTVKDMCELLDATDAEVRNVQRVTDKELDDFLAGKLKQY